MDFIFNPYAITLIFCSTITIFFSARLLGRKGEAVRWFGFMLLSNALWSMAYGFELASQNLEQIKFLIRVEYVGITTLPLYWFLFCLQLSGKECWYKKKRNIAVLIVVTVLTNVMVWTNDYHHLHYKSLTLDTSGDFPMVHIVRGVWYQLFTLYFYLMLAMGSYLLLMRMRKSDQVYRKQNFTILFAALIPWLSNLAYLLGFRPLKNLDLTPFAFIVTLILTGLAIYRFRLFDILPVAREKVLDLIQDSYLVIDGKNRVLDYNQSFKKYLVDYQGKKLIGMEMQTLFPEQDGLMNFLKNHQSGKTELTIKTSMGFYELEAEVMHLNENQLNNEVTVIKLQDLTNLKQEALKSKLQTEELGKLNQLKDKIFSIIAHDVRGPLVNLSEVLKMVSNDTISLEEIKQIAPILGKDILYTTDLLENILHWSRSQLKGYGINKVVFDLRNMILNEVNYHLPSATSKHIHIIHDVFPGLMVYADMIMIQIVVRNLLNNAIKFCSEGCEIHITAVYKPEGMIMLCIADNGIGISKPALEKLFTGLNNSTRGTMNEKGTGLGLQVCKDFMERNNGQIWAESEEGKGASFYLTLPIGFKV
ncbi:histidine kinase N-terminal 7TM domain-containing protein [Pedobacter sp. MC2016-24]|uniref:sensor histidine kinase n=1 Tax=Pedobacter sp. MC2016-24 TaxID=2780090 RepID=UPI0018804A26|nr:histidine kinase N-terminal 7TM domain-containing protein [Pedobacter sp. MC2016-24]MBE9602106.1 PAS domain-containing sensor histidine kinase [Pedobacter sp. MC2016-24]